MIDVKTGHLLIDDQHTITPQTSLATIQQWQLGASQESRAMGNGIHWVDVKNLQIDQLYFNISFLFMEQRIDGCTLTFQDQPYEKSPSWDSWSKEVEEKNLIRFNNWLDEQFGAVRELDWGKIEAFYDVKSAGSSIRLKYVA
ncbi:MAG: hypothetical protein ACRBFS_22030 [Aureispira sp.]